MKKSTSQPAPAAATPTKWQALVRDVDEWQELGYHFLEKDEVYGVPVIVKDFRRITTNKGEAVRILVEHPSYHDENGNPEPAYFVSHGEIVVRAFDNPKVHELIESREPVTFKLVPNLSGKAQYVSIE